MGKVLMLLGVVFFIFGIIMTFVGKLPGDITFKKGNVTFYFPIMTSIIVSIILSFIVYFIRRF